MTAVDAGHVSLTHAGFVSEIRLSRAAKLNAITPMMLSQLAAHVRLLQDDDNARVVVVSADGDRVFSAGADITAFGTFDAIGVWRHWIRSGHRAFAALAALPQPSIAIVQGAAFGGGLELAMACDLRIASTDAKFGLPEVAIGTVPGWGGTARLRDLVGQSRAKRLVFTGDSIDAETALQWGLVDVVVDKAELTSTARGFAERIAARSPIAVQLAKQALDHATTSNVEILEALTGAVSASTQDRSEGLAAFHERREPTFLGL